MQRVARAGFLVCALASCSANDERERPSAGTGLPGGGPIPECNVAELSELALDDVTVFGASARQMLGELGPAGELPLFWVGYDDLDAPVAYAPGVSETRLTLTISPRTDLAVAQTVAPASDDACESTRVGVPVHVALGTADGALAEEFQAALTFEQRHTASLTGEIPAEAIGGSFAFEATGALAAQWRFESLRVAVALWRGGSRGAVVPRLWKVGPASPPLRTGPESSARAAEGLGDGPAIPLHWSSLAVWPRRERCIDGPAIGPDESPFGWSPRQVVTHLTERAQRSLVTEAGAAPVRFDLEEPTGLACARQDLLTGEYLFDAPGRLRADGAAPGSPLERLDVSSSFRLIARVFVDGSGISELNWSRPLESSTLALRRVDFESGTGLVLDPAEGHQLFWWTWSGAERRASAAEPWTTQGEFAIVATDRLQEVGVGAPVGQAGMGPTAVPLFAGDTLLRATLAP